MEDKNLACAITMVKDDYFFLERWVRYYGELFGRGSLYVVSHGGDPKVAEIAAGANVIAIPGVFNEKFDAARWRLLNGVANGLRGYHEFVIVGDVDELVVVDPKTGLSLAEFLGKRRGKTTITPVGLEVVHKPELEAEPISDAILGPRRFVRFSSAYSKPCIFNHQTHLSRGGHYAKNPELKIFRNLYLLHLRYADARLYRETIERRAGQLERIGDADEKIISWNWRSDGDRTDPFARASALPVVDGFDLSAELERMETSWGPRGDEGLYAFGRDIGDKLYTLPERFFGMV